MADNITLEQYLGFGVYDIENDPLDPGKEDITFLVQVARLIPRTPLEIAKVDPSILASYCLAAHQTASSIHAKATVWKRLKELDADSALSSAIVNAGAPATNAEKRARSDELYIKASKKSAKGDAYVRFLDSMKTNFEAGHYWAKGQETAANKESKMSGYEPHQQSPGGLGSISADISTQKGGSEGQEKLGDFSFDN
jgi:hypothetical protein